VPAGLTPDPSIPANSSSTPHNVFSLDKVIYIRGLSFLMLLKVGFTSLVM
jgi:hypothetical protein